MSKPICVVKTTKLTSQPFKSMKKIKSHTDYVYDCTSAIFPDGKTKIVTCSSDCTLQIFDLESEKCEKIIIHSSKLFSVHFYEEKQLLMTTDGNGELVLWNLFSLQKKIVKKVRVSNEPPHGFISRLFQITQISSNLFFCCVAGGVSSGSLYSVEFNQNDDIDLIVEEIKYPLLNIKKQAIECIYKLKTKKNTILFSGGDFQGDNSIKKYNFRNKKHSRFSRKHSSSVNCLTSFIDDLKNNEEIVISGSSDERIIFWDLERGDIMKEIKINGMVECFLNDFRRNIVFFTIMISDGYSHFDSHSIHSLNFKTNEISKSVENIHGDDINSVKWIENEDNHNKKFRFISCSDDRSFNIYELEKFHNEYEKKDLKERINFIREEEFLQKYFYEESNRRMLFHIHLLNNFRINNIFKAFVVNK